ncbi:MAG: hypothetical protein QXL57_07905 [Candidatus Bathyarchaeia archaeon]
MNAHLKDFIISLIIGFLYLSLLVPASFAKTSIVLGSRWEVPDYEVNADTSIANMITSYSSIAGYSAYNWYGAQTNATTINWAAYGYGHVYSISFYIGHGWLQNWTHYWGWPWQWHGHSQYVITADDGSMVFDCDIYAYSYCENVKFTFLWSCHSGDVIGSMIEYPCGEVKARGMPLAWLHTNSLSGDGYVSPDNTGRAFIGFHGVGPFLTYDGLGVTDAGYYFLQYFYYAAIYRGYYYSIKGALDYAAQHVWGTNFGNCILHTGYTIGGDSGKLVVYGDGNIHISDYAGGGGGVGCPLLYVFSCDEYFYEGLLNIHNPDGVDVIQDHTLIAISEPVNNAYLLRLVEHPLTHSYIDQVKLFAILEDGKVVKLPLISATHNRYGNVLLKLLFSDDVKTDTNANEAINLKFRALPPVYKVISFLFEIEGNNQARK